jgi:hypothetical protein
LLTWLGLRNDVSGTRTSWTYSSNLPASLKVLVKKSHFREGGSCPSSLSGRGKRRKRHTATEIQPWNLSLGTAKGSHSREPFENPRLGGWAFRSQTESSASAAFNLSVSRSLP